MRVVFIMMIVLAASSRAAVLHTGPGQRYAQVGDAAKVAQPGDTILLYDGIYLGDQDLGGLKGAPGRWVYILAKIPGKAVIQGGSAALRGSSVAWLHIEGLTFTGQTGNGVNFDDGGDENTPSHHIHFHNCTFRNIAASGNNDLLKLSGVNDFTVTECIFMNGAKGGSAIDMVGCRNGLIAQSRFEDLGANAIQMKGGSSNIVVEACSFKNAGSRTINLGGNTGAAFFRPAGARYEATRLSVRSCIFSGSDAPIAFVGCTDSEVINNTIYLPTRWAIRILQENKDTLRFQKCARNTFRNNIVVADGRLRTACSTGPGTSPGTFVFSHNLWFHTTDAGWRPQLPSGEPHGIYGKDPRFIDPQSGNFSITASSPAAGAGLSTSANLCDKHGQPFRPTPSIGALEVKP